jgi:hypothetical protein
MTLDLEAIETRTNGASPAPWTFRDVSGAGLQISAILPAGFKFDATCRDADGNREFMHYTMRQDIWVQIADARWVQFGTGPWTELQERNAEFIAHARADVPALVEEVKRLTAHNTALRATVLTMQADMRDRAAKIASDHVGRAERDRHRRGITFSSLSYEVQEEIRAESRGENIAAESIAKEILALPVHSI